MALDREWMRGAAPLAVLTLLERGDMYGYELVEALERDNADRVASGKAPVGMRVAIHTGPVVVGNIGSKSRINYTIVGDAVNTAARIEELAASLHDPDSAWIVLASEETIRAGGGADFIPIGHQHLRGLSGEIGVFSLQGRRRAAADPPAVGAGPA